MWIYSNIYIYISLSLSFSLFLLSLFSVCLSVCLSLYLSSGVSVSQNTWLSIVSSVCLYIYLTETSAIPTQTASRYLCGFPGAARRIAANLWCYGICRCQQSSTHGLGRAGLVFTADKAREIRILQSRTLTFTAAAPQNSFLGSHSKDQWCDSHSGGCCTSSSCSTKPSTSNNVADGFWNTTKVIWWLPEVMTARMAQQSCRYTMSCNSFLILVSWLRLEDTTSPSSLTDASKESRLCSTSTTPRQEGMGWNCNANAIYHCYILILCSAASFPESRW